MGHIHRRIKSSYQEYNNLIWTSTSNNMSSPTEDRRRSSGTFANLMGVKRDPSNEAAAARRKSHSQLHHQRQMRCQKHHESRAYIELVLVHSGRQTVCGWRDVLDPLN